MLIIIVLIVIYVVCFLIAFTIPSKDIRAYVIGFSLRYFYILVLCMSVLQINHRYKEEFKSPCKKGKKNPMIQWQTTNKFDTVMSLVYATVLVYVLFAATYLQWFIIFYIVYVLIRAHTIHVNHSVFQEHPFDKVLYYPTAALCVGTWLYVIAKSSQTKSFYPVTMASKKGADRVMFWFWIVTSFMFSCKFLDLLSKCTNNGYDYVLTSRLLPFFSHISHFSPFLWTSETMQKHMIAIGASLLLAAAYGILFLKPYDLNTFCNDTTDKQAQEHHKSFSLLFLSGTLLICLMIIFMHSIISGAMILF